MEVQAPTHAVALTSGVLAVALDCTHGLRGKPFAVAECVAMDACAQHKG